MVNLAIVLLAAGNSSRLGQPKQLLPFIEGSLLRYQCLQALSVTKQVSCVIGHQATVMSDEINDLEIKQVINPLWQQGLSSSIAQGIAALDTKVDGALLLLIDQWQVTADDLQHMLTIWQKNTELIVAATKGPSADQITGPPVIFPRKYFHALLKHNLGNGAKMMLEKYHKQVKKLVLPHAFIDVDTPEQLIDLQRHLVKKN
jgi:molybdenum cofactor cytidylyltransferase